MRAGRRFTLGCAALTAALGVSACAAGTSGGDDEASGGELTFVSWGGGYQDAQEKEVV